MALCYVYHNNIIINDYTRVLPTELTLHRSFVLQDELSPESYATVRLNYHQRNTKLVVNEGARELISNH